MGTIATGDYGTTTTPRSDHNGPFGKPTAEEQKKLAVIYDGNAAERPAPANPSSPELSGRFYGPAILSAAIDRSLPELFTVTGATNAERAELQQRYLGLNARGVPESVLLPTWRADVAAKLAAGRPQDPGAEAARVERQAAAAIECRELLAARFGKDAESMLIRVGRYVNSVPALAEIIASVGDDPAIVEALCDHVWSSDFR